MFPSKLEDLHPAQRAKVSSIARLAHNVNRAYCKAIGDLSVLEWEDTTQEQRFGVMRGVLLYLNDPSLTPEQMHEAWMRDKYALGWKFDTVKNIELRTHPAMCPYALLPQEHKIKDHLFFGVVDCYR